MKQTKPTSLRALIHQQKTWVLKGLFCLSLGAGITPIWAQEDPDVARARAEVRRQYEANKAATKRKEIALTRQGAVTLYNINTTALNYSTRWLMWDGTYTAWTKQRIEGRKSLIYRLAGGIKLQVQFSSPGGGDKNYALESATVPSDVTATGSDGKPYQFNWKTSNSLDLIQGKPAKW